ncbi:MAG: TetR/AcrR family transcriptional regulator [Anaerolineales bacterium]
MTPDLPTTRRERRKHRTREQLKQATVDILIEKGYAPVTIQQITDQADLSRATFYVYFHDKDAAIWAVIQDSYTQLNAELQGELPADPGERVYAKWQRVFEFFEDHKDFLSVMLGDNGHIGLHRNLAQLMSHTMQEDIDRGIVGIPAGVAPPLAAQYFGGAVLQLVVWWLLDNQREMSTAALTGLFYQMLLGDPPPDAARDN